MTHQKQGRGELCVLSPTVLPALVPLSITPWVPLGFRSLHLYRHRLTLVCEGGLSSEQVWGNLISTGCSGLSHGLANLCQPGPSPAPYSVPSCMCWQGGSSPGSCSHQHPDASKSISPRRSAPLCPLTKALFDLGIGRDSLLARATAGPTPCTHGTIATVLAARCVRSLQALKASAYHEAETGTSGPGMFPMGERTPSAANACPKPRLQLGFPGLCWQMLPRTWTPATCCKPHHPEPCPAAGCLSSAPAHLLPAGSSHRRRAPTPAAGIGTV